MFVFQAPKKDAKSTKTASKAAPAKKKEGGGGKAKKKKWSKGKSRDKLNNLILFDAATYDKLLKVKSMMEVLNRNRLMQLVFPL